MIAAIVFIWDVTLISLATFPVFLILCIVMVIIMHKLTKSKLNYWGKAGALIEEVLGSIR
jgi:ABC-type bacteriocin/lantibiotic exporter with double-glycine peptidase domain